MLDTYTGQLRYSIAGHNRPLWLRTEDGACEELAGQGIVLGIFEDIELEEREVNIAPGDLVVFYTDGITSEGLSTSSWRGRLRAVITAIRMLLLELLQIIIMPLHL